jgi:hypothetical protein
MSKFQIPETQVPIVRLWFRSRGVVKWTNKEIVTSMASEIMTPATTEDGEPFPCPNWRYVGESTPMTPNEVEIREETEVFRSRGRLKAYYWGLGLSDASEKKADRIRLKLVTKLHDSVHWRWEHAGDGLADVIFYTVKLTPFTLE